MGDVYTTGQHYSKEVDKLTNYLVDDVIRMATLMDSSIDKDKLWNKLTIDAITSADNLIEAHKNITYEFEKNFRSETLSNESIRKTK